MKRREKGRSASFYRHPLGRHVNDLILLHEQGRDDRIVLKCHPISSQEGSIFALYGGREEYIKAMEHIYRRETTEHIARWDKHALVCVDVFEQITPRAKKALVQNYNTLFQSGELFSEWIPVFWYARPDYVMSVGAFMERMLQGIHKTSVNTSNMCMYKSRRLCDTRIYMRRSYLQNYKWGRTQILVFESMNQDYIISHQL